MPKCLSFFVFILVMFLLNTVIAEEPAVQADKDSQDSIIKSETETPVAPKGDAAEEPASEEKQTDEATKGKGVWITF